MTKKDYEKFAAMLREYNPYDEEYSITSSKVLKHHVDIIMAVASIFAEDNRNFDQQKFINAIIKR